MLSGTSLTTISSNNNINSIKVYKYRWMILALFDLVSIINFMQLLQFSIISNIISKFYNVESFLVDLTGLIFFISYIILFYPISYLIEKYNLKLTVGCAMLLTLAGNLLKLLAANPDRFWLVLLAQAFIAIGQVYLYSIPSKLATTWFGSEEVSTACAIGVLGMQLGTALGCVQSPMIVKNESSDIIQGQLFDMFLYQAIVSFVAFILVLCLFRTRPQLPPSQSQVDLLSNSDALLPNFFENMKKIGKNKNFWLVVFSLGLANGVWNSFGILLNTLYLHYFPTGENDAGLIALITIISGGCIGSMIVGILLDKTHEFKKISIFLLASSSLIYIGVIFTLIEKSRIGTFIVIPIFGFFLAPVLIVGFEYLVEITYPISEACSASAFNASYNLLGIVATLLLGALYDSIGYFYTFVATFIIFACATMTILFVKSDLRRRDANLHRSNVNNNAMSNGFDVTNTTVSVAHF